MTDNTWVRCAEDDPNRCQAVHSDQQCPYKAIEGQSYCPRHCGPKNAKQDQVRSQKMYLSAKWQERIGFQAEHPKVKSLREEMGILRMMLDAKLNQLNDEQELTMHAGAITELVREIGKLARIAHGIEKDMNVLLDRNQALEWVQEIVEIIDPFLPSPDDKRTVSDRLVASLEARTSGAIGSTS